MAASASPHSPARYRPEIDGLRALSVMLVVLFHAGFGFPGGFIGVDVFFVISGYLITGIIIRGLENQRFSLADFYCRRVRRIFPAAAVVLAIVLLAGLRSMLPNDLQQVSLASIYQSFFAANHFFWMEAGYFSRDMATKPLLHTWSLAVEEQFYLLYPTLLVLLCRWRPNHRATAIAMIASAGTVSFLLNLYGILHHPSFTFYHLPTRAWELMAGAGLAVSAFSVNSRWTAEILAWIGVAAIVLASLIINESAAFPGAWALLPVAGGVAFIAANTNQTTSAGKLFACRPVVFVGLISYSLYLWHWPVLAFLRYLIKDPTGPTLAAAVVVSMLLATASWWLVEQPVRTRRILSRNRHLLIGSGMVWMAILLASIGIYRSHGLPGRFDESQAALIEDASWIGMEYVRSIEQIEREGPARLGVSANPDQPGGFLLWGDSHAAVLAHMLDNLAAESGKQGFVALRGGTPPIPGLSHGGMPRSREFNTAVMQFIDRQQITDVILVSRWAVYVTGFSPWDPKTDDRRNEDLYLSDSSQPSRTGAESLRAMRRKLGELVDELKRKGVRVWLLKQVPSQQSLVAEVAVRNMLLGSDINKIRPTTVEQHQRHQEPIRELYESIAAKLQETGGDILDPATVLFDSRGNGVLVANGRYTYRDDDHVSKSGAELLAPLLRQALGP